MGTEKPTYVSELREKCGIPQDPDGKTTFNIDPIKELTNTIMSFSKSIPGSTAYAHALRDKVGGLTQDMLFRNNTLPLAFHTLSMAEYYWPEVFKAIHDYLTLWGDHSKAAAFEDGAAGKKVRDEKKLASEIHRGIQELSTVLNKVREYCNRFLLLFCNSNGIFFHFVCRYLFFAQNPGSTTLSWKD